MRNYLLTIITVVYNGADLIGKTIESVSQNKNSLLEYIVIDGGSKDGTSEVVGKYRGVVDQYLSEPDHGIFDAMNKGINLANGKWLVFINAGDQLLPDFFQRIDLITLTDSALVYGNTIRERHIRTFPYELSYIKTGNLPMCHQSTLYNREILGDRLFYKTQYRLFSENELMMRIYTAGMKCSYVNEDIAYFLGGGISSIVSNETRKAKYKYVFKYFGIKGVLLAVLMKIGVITKERYAIADHIEINDYIKVI